MKKSLLLCTAAIVVAGMTGCATYDGEGIFFDGYSDEPGYEAGFFGPGYGYYDNWGGGGYHHGGHHHGAHHGGGHHGGGGHGGGHGGHR